MLLRIWGLRARARANDAREAAISSDASGRSVCGEYSARVEEDRRSKAVLSGRARKRCGFLQGDDQAGVPGISRRKQRAQPAVAAEIRVARCALVRNSYGLRAAVQPARRIRQCCHEPGELPPGGTSISEGTLSAVACLPPPGK